MNHYLLCNGSYDSRHPDKQHPNAGKNYGTISFEEIVNRAKNPTAFEKAKAPAIIPSTYNGPDGRSHDAQRRLGKFGLICIDIDTGNHDLETIKSIIKKVMPGAQALIYSSASASEDNKKWRIIIPLETPIPGEQYGFHAEAAYDIFEENGVECDYALARTGQLAYLPNVPSERRENAFPIDPPLFYQYAIIDGEPLDPLNSQIGERAKELQRERVEVENKYREEREARPTNRLSFSSDDLSPIEAFNRANEIEGLLNKYQYKAGPRGNYRSPNQKSSSYATLVLGNKWVSLSTSDRAIGQTSRNGNRFGDAFDLYVAYEYGEDFQRALDAVIAQQRQQKVREAMADDGFERRQRQRSENQTIGDEEPQANDVPFPPILTLDQAEKQFVYITDGSRIVDSQRPTCDLSFSDFKNATAASFVIEEYVDRNGVVKQRKKSVADEYIKSPARLTCDTKTFAPGKDKFTYDPNGRPALNTWRPFNRPQIPDYMERVQPFLDHANYLFGEQTDRYFDWLAHIEQRPGELPHTGWVHISRHPGTGRNLVSSALARVWRGQVAASVNLADILMGQFNERIAQKLLAIVDEIREGGGNKWSASERLKSVTTEEVRLINPKYGRQYVEFNRCRWLIFSNHQSALPLDQADRRFEVAECLSPPKSPEYYKVLYALLDDATFINSIGLYLLNRDISNFNPGQKAQMSQAKVAMIEANESETKQWLRMLQKHYSCDIVSASALKSLLSGDQLFDGASPQNFTAEQRHSIEDLGFKKLGSLRLGLKPERFYAIRNGTEWESPRDLQKLRQEYSKSPFANGIPRDLREYLMGMEADGDGGDDVF